MLLPEEDCASFPRPCTEFVAQALMSSASRARLMGAFGLSCAVNESCGIRVGVLKLWCFHGAFMVSGGGDEEPAKAGSAFDCCMPRRLAWGQGAQGKALSVLVVAVCM